MKRGDVILVRFPHPSGIRGKKRPAVVVQSDAYSSKIGTILVAEVTSNLALSNDPSCLLIDTKTPDGQQTGLGIDSVISCLRLAFVYPHTVDQVVGGLSNAMLAKLDDCLKAALGLP